MWHDASPDGAGAIFPSGLRPGTIQPDPAYLFDVIIRRLSTATQTRPASSHKLTVKAQIKKMACVAVLRFLVLVLAWTLAAFAVSGEQDCYDDRDWIMEICYESIKKEGPYALPNVTCRREVRKVDMPCICRVLTAADERVISAEKLVRCARDSGVNLPFGTKCGSYPIVVPPPPPPFPRP